MTQKSRCKMEIVAEIELQGCFSVRLGCDGRVGAGSLSKTLPRGKEAAPRLGNLNWSCWLGPIREVIPGLHNCVVGAPEAGGGAQREQKLAGQCFRRGVTVLKQRLFDYPLGNSDILKISRSWEFKGLFISEWRSFI